MKTCKFIAFGNRGETMLLTAEHKPRHFYEQERNTSKIELCSHTPRCNDLRKRVSASNGLDEKNVVYTTRATCRLYMAKIRYARDIQ